MAFMLLIVEPRGQRASRSQEEAHRRYDEMLAFGKDLQERGLLKASESLRTDDHAVRISRTDDKPPLRDGPFAEAKEMVGGFYLIDVATRDEAVNIAGHCPATRWSTVEVRECAPCYVV
jgi:hypothetical protein